MSLLQESVIFLTAAVVAVPLFKALGLGSVLGYVAAGIVIGPAGLGLIAGVENVMHFAEFGVVMLLFIIGLELKPSRLWLMRKGVFGVGGAQVIITGCVFTALALLFELPLATAAVAGFAWAMSSTAFALQLLGEREEMHQPHGRAAFGVLLFQDLAVIPLIAVVPLLSGERISDVPIWLSFIQSLAVLGAVFIIGRYVIKHVLRLLARVRSQEVLTAFTLLLVAGTAWLMSLAGISMALGSFMAGVLLADSEFRHQLEADIEPFKSLLLGLFFISIGMSFLWAPVLETPLLIIGLTLLLLTIKGSILYVLGRISGLPHVNSIRLAATLPQGGEFAFVIFSAAVTAGIMDAALSSLLVVVIILSMAATPVLVILADRIARQSTVKDKQLIDENLPDDRPVIIAGFGRFGQIVARILAAKHIPFTAVDVSSTHVDYVRKFGNKIYYGDATRLELLRAAGAGDARLILIAIDDVEASLTIARLCREHFPNLKVYSRARNRQHVYRLMELGVEAVKRDTFASSLEMAQLVLQARGMKNAVAKRTVQKFRVHDEERLEEGYQHWEDEEKLRTSAIQAADELKRLFEADAAEGEQKEH